MNIKLTIETTTGCEWDSINCNIDSNYQMDSNFTNQVLFLSKKAKDLEYKWQLNGEDVLCYLSVESSDIKTPENIALLGSIQNFIESIEDSQEN